VVVGMSAIRHRTRTGIEIGLAYTKPEPREIGSQAEAIQTALLRRLDPRSHVIGSTIPPPEDPQDAATRSARADYDRTMRSLRPIRSATARVVRWVMRMCSGGRDERAGDQRLEIKA
jgi:hypothetical protein